MTQTWYIVKGKEGTCEILSDDRLTSVDEAEIAARWGPFESIEEAIARRVGLIRSGKCQPQ
ncbi:MAG TPA: DDE transposase family protein [Oscillatoriales cyanobacterium M59_W2019_021]|nr:DDE transposase family protein [Oscillatoriales cyanobacterium M59_W2019_021]